MFENRGSFGFDVSYGEGYPPNFPVTDFAKMKAYGARFCGMKATQGNWRDGSFVYNWSACKGILPRFAYHFYDNYYTPHIQAHTFWEAIRNDPEGIAWLDLEDRDSGSYAGWHNWYDFIEEFDYISNGYPFGIYAGYYYFTEYTAKASKTQKDYFKKFPLWLPNYGDQSADWYKNPVLEQIQVPYPWTWDDVKLLQTGTPAIGQDVGVSSHEIDYNIYNGDFGEPMTEVPTGDNMITFKAKIAIGATPNYRDNAGTSATILGQLKGGDLVQGVGTYVNKDNYNWILMTYPVAGWLAVTSNVTEVQYDPNGLQVAAPHVSITFTDEAGKVWGADNVELFPR